MHLPLVFFVLVLCLPSPSWAQSYGQGAPYVGSPTWGGPTAAATGPADLPDWSGSYQVVWRFEETSGTRINDTSATCGTTCDLNVDNNTVGSTTSALEGARAADFERDTNEWFECSTCDDQLGGANTMCVGSWIKMESDVQADLLAQGNTAGGSPGSRDATEFTRTLGGALLDNVTITNGTSDTCALNSTAGSIPITEWVHWVFQIGDSGGEIWINGASDATTGTCSFDRPSLDACIGANNSDGTCDTSQNMDGVLDEMFVGDDTGECTTANICRVCSCGISGEKCKGDAENPTEYFPCTTNTDCGGAAICDSVTDDNCDGGTCCVGRNGLTPSSTVGGCGDCDLPDANTAAP